EGRSALDKGDLDKAEKLAHDAEKADKSWSHMFGDSPSRLLTDVQAARTKVAQNKSSKPATTVAGTTKPSVPSTKPETSPSVATTAPTQPSIVHKPEATSGMVALPPPVWPEEPKKPVDTGLGGPPKPAVAAVPPKPEAPKPSFVVAPAPAASDTDGARALL